MTAQDLVNIVFADFPNLANFPWAAYAYGFGFTGVALAAILALSVRD